MKCLTSVLHLTKTGAGKVRLVPEVPDDLWALYELVEEGDYCTSQTTRKIKQENASGNINVDVKRLILSIEVTKTDYEACNDTIRFSGRILSEVQDIRKGAFHTLEVHPNQQVTIEKACWDELSKTRLMEALDTANQAEVGALLLDSQKANLYLVTASTVKDLCSVTGTKAKVNVYSKAKKTANNKFYDSIMLSMNSQFKMDILKCIIIGGTPDVTAEFVDYLMTNANAKGYPKLSSRPGMYVQVECNGTGRNNLAEAIQTKEASARIGDVRTLGEVTAVGQLQKALAMTPPKACYGPGPVSVACEFAAVSTLCILETVFKNVENKKRRYWADLAENVKAVGGTVVIVSQTGLASDAIKSVGGIGAILRFPLAQLDDLDPTYLPEELK